MPGRQREWRHRPSPALSTAAALSAAVSGTTLGTVSRRQYAKLIAQLAVFSYLVGFAFDLNINLLLLLLAAGSIASAFLSFGEGAHLYRSWVIYPLGLFLLSLGLSVLFSTDVFRSLQSSAPMLPAVLLFFLIYEYFLDARDLRHLYICFTIVALGLAVMLLWTALANSGAGRGAWIVEVGSPILIVGNDVTFLAIIAPLSLALVFLQPRSMVAILALTSMVLTLFVAMIYLSRTATVTFLISVLCTIAALRAGRYVFVLLIGVVLVAGIDFLDRPALLGKFLEHGFDPGSGRLDAWAAAWAMFVDAPLVGQGLHTFRDTTSPWAHNLYLQTLAEQGIVGLLALLLLLSYATMTAWKTARSPIREQRILAAGALGALVGFCTASVVELTLLREWVVLQMLVLVALAARVPCGREDA